MARKASDKAATESPKRKRGPRGTPTIVAEHAAAYGISLPEETSSERFLSPNDIGKVLNVTGEAVKQWIYRRKLPAVKLANGYWKVKVSDFEAFLRARHEVGRRHILITSAQTDDLADIVKAVEHLGHQPVLAHSYADALLKALDHFPALFIINLSASETEPWKFAEKIRATKALRSFPILFISSKNLSDDEADRALQLYAQGQLTRPLPPETLVSEVERILRRSM